MVARGRFELPKHYAQNLKSCPFDQTWVSRIINRIEKDRNLSNPLTIYVPNNKYEVIYLFYLVNSTQYTRVEINPVWYFECNVEKCIGEERPNYLIKEGVCIYYLIKPLKCDVGRFRFYARIWVRGLRFSNKPRVAIPYHSNRFTLEL